MQLRHAVLALSIVVPAFAGGAAAAPGAPGHGHHHGAAAAYGEPGDPRKPARIIQVVMRDEMRFVPERFEIRRGEHIRFVARNVGALRHEMVLGTMEELREHAALMQKSPGMEHDDANALTLDAKRAGEMHWRFTTRGTFYIGCLVPGHLEQGMVATVVVK